MVSGLTPDRARSADRPAGPQPGRQLSDSTHVLHLLPQQGQRGDPQQPAALLQGCQHQELPAAKHRQTGPTPRTVAPEELQLLCPDVQH